MRQVIARFVLSIVLTATWLSPQSVAQQGETEQPKKNAAALARLYERWQQTQDVEQRIALGEQILPLEKSLQDWPLQGERNHVKGELWFGLGNAYLDSIRGDRADNQDRAIASYEAALTVFTREVLPREWAQTLHNLAIAYGSRIGGDRDDNIEKAIAAFEEALTVRTREALPRDWAMTQSNLALAHAIRIRGDRADNQDKAIASYEAALTVFTREVLPREWAQTQHNLAIAYGSRVRGDRADNVEKAIAAYEAALTVRTREALSREWADTQVGVGNAYWNRIRGNRADNLENAIAAFGAALTVRTRETLPFEWAQAQNNFGLAYWNRIRGNRVDNVERAIAAYEAALTVFTRETLPREWAQTLNNFADAYQYRIRGDRADNLEQAIAAYEAALTVRTREALPPEWARTQNNLAVAYQSRIRGDRADNLEKAIVGYQAALTVRTREAMPREWGETQNNLGIAYAARMRGDRADNAEKAIAAFEAALTVRTREALPREWADTQNNLAAAYHGRIQGDRTDNLEKAIGALEAVLTIFTREALPREWADTQHNLAFAYWTRIRGDRADNLQKAIGAYEAALTIRTREALPLEHLRTGRRHGSTLLEARKWREAGLAYASAREAFLLLLGQGFNEAEARSLITEAGPMFAEAAFAAAQRGEHEVALTLASEGRARLMAVALKLQALDISADKRQRLDELRADIRAADRAVDATQGIDRAVAVEKLSSLRQELLRFVKAAEAVVSRPATALVQALAVAGGGAVVVPIVTKYGSKILIASAGTTSRNLSVLDLPDLTNDRLNVLMRGDGRTNGWLGAYSINYLPSPDQNQRWKEWLAAVDNLGPELWRLFGAKLDATLKARGIKPGSRLVWLPSSALGILPLGLAQDPASKRRLADGYEIVYAPSLVALTAAQQRIAEPASAATLAAIVNPTEDLPGTEKEGKLVASHFPSKARTVLERTAAVPEAVLAALKGKTHWHFASHGTFSWTDARQSALLMHGQAPLSVGQLLETEGLGRPRLVVLSACETGLYDINSDADEFIGLPGTFTALGAAGVVGTLWPVSDAATALLMARFYELHMGQGLAPPTALSRAQTWLRQAPNADLQVYARLAAKQGRLESRHVTEIEQELSVDGLTRSRNNSAIEWATPDIARAKKGKALNDETRSARPYAHPYFWAGFIHTGL